MRNIKQLLAMILLGAIVSMFAIPLVAQDATATPDSESTDNEETSNTRPIICESSLVLLVGLAQRDYGFESPMNLDELERGQYADLYDTENDDMETGEATPEATAEVDTDADANEDGDVGTNAGSIILDPPVVLNEDVRCTELRTSIEEFFSTDRQPNSSNMDDTQN